METKPPVRKLLKKPFSQSHNIQGLCEEFRRIFKNNKVQIIFKRCNTLKTLLMHPKDKMSIQLHHGCGIPMDLPNCKLQFYLHRRIKQMFSKQSQGTQNFIHRHNISTQHNLQSSQGRHITD